MIASPIVVWGAGAMGGSIGAYLVRAGHEVVFVDSDTEHATASSCPSRTGSMSGRSPLAEASIAEVLAAPEHRPTIVALAREVVAVTFANGVRPEAFDGFDPLAFAPEAPDEVAQASLDRLVAFNRASAKSQSGVWRDLAVRKRKTEIDAQIAPIAELGAEVGVETPLVRRLVELIHDVEEGRRKQGWETLGALALGGRGVV